MKILVSSVPLLVIAGLIYAGLFIKPRPVGAAIPSAMLERGDAFYGLAFVSPSTIWACGTDGKIIKSEDGGNTWAIQATPVRHAIQDIAAWDARHAVAVGNHGAAMFTGDGGATWALAKAPVSPVANKLLRVLALPDGSAWAVGEYGTLLRSGDRGASWGRVLPEEDAAWNGIDFQGDAGWIAGEFGRLMRTVDGGRTWSPIDTGIRTSLMAVRFRDARHGVAVGLGGVVLVSDDGGVRWRQAPAAIREHLFAIEWQDGRWTAAGAKGFVLTSSAPLEGWTVSTVSSTDRAWHTRVVAANGALYLAGASLVALEDGKAAPLVRNVNAATGKNSGSDS